MLTGDKILNLLASDSLLANDSPCAAEQLR